MAFPRSMLASAVASLCLGAACGAMGTPKPTARSAVLVTIDTLRADHLGCYGYPRPTSPFIDELASRGVLFDNAFASMASTVPSHTSLFTSLYPLQHGVLKNGYVLDDGVVTLAEVLGGRGFRTGAFSSTTQFGRANVGQGFEVLSEARRSTRPGGEVVDAAIEWLDGLGPRERFFLWVHLFDPHPPLRPPPEMLARFTGQPPAAREAHAAFLVREQHIDPDAYDSVEEMMRTIDEYDAEVAYADAQVRRLHERVGSLGRPTVFIVTADHGEGLGSHGWYGHGKHIYNEQLRTLLLIEVPGLSGPGRRVDRVVESVDVPPTLLALLDEEGALPAAEGVSLAPLFRSAVATVGDGYAFSQRCRFDRRPDPGDPKADRYEPGEKYALQDATYKLIHRPGGPDELFDLTRDPYEGDNLSGRLPEVEGPLRERMIRHLARLKAGRGSGEQVVDQETIDALRELGYIP